MREKEFVLAYGDNHFNNMKDDIVFQLRKIAEEMKKEYTTSCIIVVIKSCDERGRYSKMDIHIFDTFISANDIINTEMYRDNNIEVYQYNCLNDEFTNVMYKCYDSNTYSRLAWIKTEKMFGDNFLFKVRKVYDMEETKVTIHSL